MMMMIDETEVNMDYFVGVVRSQASLAGRYTRHGRFCSQIHTADTGQCCPNWSFYVSGSFISFYLRQFKTTPQVRIYRPIISHLLLRYLFSVHFGLGCLLRSYKHLEFISMQQKQTLTGRTLAISLNTRKNTSVLQKLKTTDLSLKRCRLSIQK